MKPQRRERRRDFDLVPFLCVPRASAVTAGGLVITLQVSFEVKDLVVHILAGRRLSFLSASIRVHPRLTRSVVQLVAGDLKIANP